MKDEDTSRKESGAHLTSKKCIVGNEDIGLIRVRLLPRVETDQSLLNVREVTKREGWPRPSSSRQVITEFTPLSSFLSLRKKKIVMAKRK